MCHASIPYTQEHCFMSQGNVLFVGFLEVIVLRRDQGMMKKRTSGERKGKEPEKKKTKLFLLLTDTLTLSVRLTTRFKKRIFSALIRVSFRFSLWVKQMAKDFSLGDDFKLREPLVKVPASRSRVEFSQP